MKRALLVALLAALLLANIVCIVRAQGGGYSLDRSILAAGGVTAHNAGAYSLNGTLAQPFAATWQGGSYTLLGGFWGIDTKYVFLPITLK